MLKQNKIILARNYRGGILLLIQIKEDKNALKQRVTNIMIYFESRLGLE